MKQICMALDLKDDEVLIDQYVAMHRISAFPQQVATGLRAVGIEDMEIHIVENRLFMILKARDDFDFSHKLNYDNQNIFIKEWEALMWNFQVQIKNSKSGEKWRVMDRIFSLKDYLSSDDVCVMSQ